MITEARPSDVGTYVCTARNVIGEDRRRVDLDVWGKFFFVNVFWN